MDRIEIAKIFWQAGEVYILHFLVFLLNDYFSDFFFMKTASDPKAKCNPEFFDPKLHKKHMSDMKLNEKMYLEHMIPHHQVAVNMSKTLLKHTNNDFMISFAYRIIRSQQEEINYMKQLLENLEGWCWNSELIN